MPEIAENITRFRKNLKQFLSLKEAGKLNGRAVAIEEKLKDSAEIAGLDFESEVKDLQGSGKNPKMKSEKKKEHPKPRKNPVEVPFTITLKKIDKLHSIRSVKKLNSYVGHKHPCYIARHSGEKPNSHISFKYDPDYRNKKYTLDLLLNGKLEYTACVEGADKNFAAAWKEVLNEYGDLTVEIRSQDHAKKVLGAAEYRRQENQQESEEPKDEKPGKSYKDFPIGSTVETVGLPDKVDGKTNPLIGAKGTVTHTQKNDVVVNIEGYGETGFLPENLELIESKEEPVLPKKEKPAGKKYEPNFSQLATYLAFIRGQDYDYTERFINRIEDYSRTDFIDEDKNIIIKETWKNREYDQDHERWYLVSRGGKHDTLYNKDVPDEKDLKVIEVDTTIDPDKLDEKPAYDISNQPIKKKVKINRSVMLREIILGKMEAARYKSFDGMTDSTVMISDSQKDWYDPAESGWFWSQNFRDFQPSSYSRPYHSEPNEISLGNFEYRYKAFKEEKAAEKKEESGNDKISHEAFDLLPFYQREAINKQGEKARKESLKTISKQYREVPELRGQDGKGKDAEIFIHIFNGNSDWYITELDKDTQEGFGFAVLNGDWQMAELGYISLKELLGMKEYNPGKSPEVDLFWKNKTINEVIDAKKPKEVIDTKDFIAGDKTDIDFKADGSVSVPGYYALVDVKDIVASHNKDCTVNSSHDISKAQPRDRSVEALCAQPKFIAKNLNPTSITVGNLAFNGTPVLTFDLQAIQGNGRSISMKIVYDEVPPKAMLYRTYLMNNAGDWGFTKKDVQSFDKPVLVRIADVTKEKAIELGNIVDTSQAKLNKVDAAKAYVRNLPEEKRKIIGDIINDSKGETLGEIIDDKGLKIFDQFKDLDRSDLVENNKLTGEGKDFLRSVFAGLVFDSEDRKNALQAFLNVTHTIKAGIERSYGHIIPFIGTKADITPEIRGAVLIIDALFKRSEIETVDELFSSVDAFEGSFADKFTDNEKALAEFLTGSGKQKEIRDAFRMYQYFITGKEDLFNPIEKTTPQAAFIFAFVEKHRLNPGKKEKVHKLKVRIQRLQSLGNDNSKDIQQLNELIGENGWSWNAGKTKINIGEQRPNPKSAKFVFLGVVDKLLIDQGRKKLVELQGPHGMLTNKSKSKIFIVPFALISQFNGNVKDKKAEEIFKEWNNYDVDGKDMQISWPDQQEALPVGTAHSIFYISDKVLREGDKKGKMNVYHHEFDPGKRPASKKGNILVVGNLEIDERGILN